MHSLVRAWEVGNQADRKASLLTRSGHGWVRRITDHVRRSIFAQTEFGLSFSPKTIQFAALALASLELRPFKLPPKAQLQAFDLAAGSRNGKISCAVLSLHRNEIWVLEVLLLCIGLSLIRFSTAFDKKIKSPVGLTF